MRKLSAHYEDDEFAMAVLCAIGEDIERTKRERLDLETHGKCLTIEKARARDIRTHK